MTKIPFENSEILQQAKVTIDGVDYPVTPAQMKAVQHYLSAEELNVLQDNIESAINDIKEQDTGWQPITLNEGYSNAYAWAPCTYRRIGNIIQLVGYVKGFSKISYTIFGSIPDEHKPKRAQQYVNNVLNDANKIAILNINTDNTLSFSNANFSTTQEDAININATFLVE